MLKILVTGGSGFVGSYVARAFCDHGDDVLIFDRVAPASGLAFIKGDLASEHDLLKACKGIDIVCHLGAVGDVYLAMEQPRLAVESNVLGTLNVLEACKNNGVPRVIYASTWEVYGDPQYSPVDEKHPCCPHHPYSITKLAGEQLVMSYSANWGMETVSLRLGTGYGLGMRDSAVIPVFILKALQGKPLSITGSGKEFRQFTHAADIARAFVIAARAEGVAGEAFNIVAAEKVSVRNLAEVISKKVPAIICYNPPRVAEAPSAEVSSAKATQKLAWEPARLFQEGLDEMISYYANCRNGPVPRRDDTGQSAG